jgi:hypothetical protein
MNSSIPYSQVIIVCPVGEGLRVLAAQMAHNSNGENSLSGNIRISEQTLIQLQIED